MLALLGKKLGQTRVYDPDGVMIHVTVVQVGPNRVLQCKTQDTDGYDAVQLGFGVQKDSRLTKSKLGHLRRHGVEADRKDPREPLALDGVQRIREFRDFSLQVKPGDLLGPDVFAQGDFVDVIGITKGKGFEGVVKRHGFRGGDSTHGAKGWHRRSGAIGQRLFPGTVRRGMRMPGHMGQVRRTVQNLQVIQVRPDDNVLLIKGALPGASGDFVIVREAKKLPKGSARAEGRLAADKAATTGKAGKTGKK